VFHGETVSIDLTLAPATLWHQTRADHRNQINRARRAGHRAFIDEGLTKFETFQRIYQATMRRVNASPYYVFNRTYFEGLREALGDRLQLCLVEIDHEIAAAGLFIETDGIVQFHLSGTRAAYLRHAPTKLMVDHMRDRAKERGALRLHLGGGRGGGNDALFAFKAGFAPDRHPFHTLRVVLDQAAYAELVQARDPKADPMVLDGFFPGYREPR
jgi:lipid II:glycine glycyltransferase (peptidoglycan interpeptide bridge formation enzyme)